MKKEKKRSVHHLKSTLRLDFFKEDSQSAKDLWVSSVEARKKAYAPYSKFKVGAALLGADGEIFTGCNVENASYGGTICAERVAILKAVSDSKKKFKAIAISATPLTSDFIPPCGLCLQTLNEFCDPDMPVVLGSPRKVIAVKKLRDFLPLSFSKKSFKQ